MKNKKSKKANLERFRFIYLQVGLIIAACAALVAFEWNVADSKPKIEKLEKTILSFGEEFDVEIPEQKPDDPEPQRRNPNPNPDPSVSSSPTTNITTVVESKDQSDLEGLTFEPLFGDLSVNNASHVDIIVDNYELMNKAEFPGGEKAMYEFLAKHIKYPLPARQAGIQGTVNVEFIVGKDGTIESSKVLSGIGGGCNEESIRVVNLMPKWKPGEQYGYKVKVKYVLPIKYTLN